MEIIAVIILLFIGVQGLAITRQDDEYLGCFRALPEDIESATLAFRTASAPADCITECQRRYFM